MSDQQPELTQYILGYSSDSSEAQAYLRTHLARLIRTLEITPPGAKSDRLLEMGAYMQITPAFQTKLGYGEVRGCYLGSLGRIDRKTVTSSTGETFECFVDLFNAEKDAYPYRDGSFATVVCTELLEHLAVDPMHLLCEVNRILRPGGSLVLSTPNICSLRSVAAVVTGYHPALFPHYTKPVNGQTHGDRHEREYAPREIPLLLNAAGFSVTLLETGTYGLDPLPDYEWAADILRKRGESLDLRGDTIHVVAGKTGPVEDRYPSWLYV